MFEVPSQRSQPPGDVGRAIKALRERQGLTDVQLARLSHSATETIQRIESGLTQRPSYLTLGRIARALNVDVRALLDGALPQDAPADAADDPAPHAPLALRDAWRSGDFTDDDLRAVASAVPPDTVAEAEVALMRVWLRAARSLRLAGREAGMPALALEATRLALLCERDG
ncbi:MAG: helix-turn-helix transcriptional regulator [Polyangiales bacterium]